MYYNEDTKQFEFSESYEYTTVIDPFQHTVRHPLYGIGVDSSKEAEAAQIPAKIYKIGCTAPDKANYGNYCIWDGPKVVYKTINRTIYPPYGEYSKIEKWKFGKNTGQLITIDMVYNGPDGIRQKFSGLGKSSKYYNEDGTEKPQTDN